MPFPLSAEDFHGRFPEFESLTGEAIVQEKLDAAADEIDADVWGDLADKGHGWLTAHLLTRSGYGRETSEGSTTTYEQHYEDMRRRVGTAHRVVL